MAKHNGYIDSVILCEDIRSENNGKLIFIGVYPADVHVSAVPVKLGFSFWLIGKARGKDEKKVSIVIELKVKSSKKTVELFNKDLDIPLPPPEHEEGDYTFRLALIGLKLDVTDSSVLIVKERLSANKYTTLLEANILVKERPDSVLQK